MFKKYQLKNGMKVLLVESHKSPVLSIQMWVQTGSADERRGEEGISHFIEHLVFKGTRKFNVGEIAAAVEGAGGELNAYTSFDQTVFYVTISKEFQHVGFDVIQEMMGYPRFDSAEIDNEREVVIEEIKRSNDSPHRQASRLLFTSVYKKHPYGIPVIGYTDNIRNVSRDTLVDYFQTRYNPKTMTLVVAGDFNSREIQKQIQQRFGRFLSGKVRKVKRPPVAAIRAAKVAVESAPFNETLVHLAFPVPKASHKDIPALEVLALILGQGESSRLSYRLRLQENLVNYAGASVFVAKDPGFFAVSLSLNSHDLQPALRATQDEIIRVLSDFVSDEEWQKAVTNLASEQYYQLESVDGLARNFGHYQDLFGDPAYFQKFMRQVQNLTPRDVLRVARKYLKPASCVFVVQSNGEKARMEGLCKTWLTAFKGAHRRAVKGQPKAPAKKRQSRSQLLFPARKSGPIDVEKWTLANGITVVTRPSFDTPVISVRCASLGGSRLETQNTQGATELLSRVWTSGLGSLSELDVLKKTDAMAASLSAFSGRNSSGLSMACLRTFQDEMLELMALALTDPKFEDAAIKRELKSMQEHVKMRADNPAQVCLLEFLKTMFGNHPYGRDPYGDLEHIDKLQREHVESMFRMRSGLTVVASGALDPDEFRERVQSQLGHLRPGTGESQTFAIQFPKQNAHRTIASEKEQSHVMYGYPGLTLRAPERYTLQVMQAILAGQGGRLFVELRDKASLAYSVSPMRMEGLEGGYFGAYIGCSPEKVDTALRMMKEEFAKLSSESVSPAELARAQRYLIGKHDIELQKNSNITSAILFDQIYGIDFMETYRFAERIRAIDSAAIRMLAEKLFSQPTVTCIVGPQASS